MEKQIARQVRDLMMEFSDKLTSANRDIRKHSPPQEYNRYRSATGQLLTTIFSEVLAPLLAEHPDLAPEEISGRIDPKAITRQPRAHSKSLVPRDKFDLERADKLESLDQTALQQIAADLLVWMQDMNWPVAGRVARALARVGPPIAPLLREVLQGRDEQWKYWCIEQLITKLPLDLASQLRADLSRISHHPTREELTEEVNEVARDALEQLFGEKAC